MGKSMNQWMNHELLPDSAYNAQLAELAKLGIQDNSKIKRTTSVEWNEKLCRSHDNKRCISEATPLSPDEEKEIRGVIENTIQEIKQHESHKTEVRNYTVKIPEDPPYNYNQQVFHRVPGFPIAEIPEFMGKKRWKVDLSLGVSFPPANWLYENCRTDEEFDTMWDMVSVAYDKEEVDREERNRQKMKTEPKQARERSSFARRTLRCANYFIQKLRKAKSRVRSTDRNSKSLEGLI